MDAYLIIHESYEETTQVIEILTEDEFKSEDNDMTGMTYRICNGWEKFEDEDDIFFVSDDDIKKFEKIIG